MSVGLIIGIGLLGGFGALARFALDRSVTLRTGAGFPLGTLSVNLAGTFAVGALVGLSAGDRVDILLGAGMLGAFTTFSTLVWESHRLAESGRLMLGTANIGLSLLLGLVAVLAGRAIGAML